MATAASMTAGALAAAAFSSMPCPTTRRKASSMYERSHRPPGSSLQSTRHMVFAHRLTQRAVLRWPDLRGSIRAGSCALSRPCMARCGMRRPVAFSILSASIVDPSTHAQYAETAADSSRRPGMPPAGRPMGCGNTMSSMAQPPHLHDSSVTRRAEIFMASAAFATGVPLRLCLAIHFALDASRFAIGRTLVDPIRLRLRRPFPDGASSAGSTAMPAPPPPPSVMSPARAP